MVEMNLTPSIDTHRRSLHWAATVATLGMVLASIILVAGAVLLVAYAVSHIERPATPAPLALDDRPSVTTSSHSRTVMLGGENFPVITGVDSADAQVDDRLTICNVAHDDTVAASVTLLHQSPASRPENRLFMAQSLRMLGNNTCAEFRYITGVGWYEAHAQDPSRISVFDSDTHIAKDDRLLLNDYVPHQSPPHKSATASSGTTPVLGWSGVTGYRNSYMGNYATFTVNQAGVVNLP
jgi:hypothetical protein